MEVSWLHPITSSDFPRDSQKHHFLSDFPWDSKMSENLDLRIFSRWRKILENHCNPGIFCFKRCLLLETFIFRPKKWRKKFSETSRRKFVAYPPKFDGQKSHQILNIEIFDDMCLMCEYTINCLKWPWGTSELAFFVSRSYSTCGERYSTFYLGIGKKKWSKRG